MSCIDPGLLRSMMDGEIEQSDRETVDRHLADCAACRARLEQLRAESEEVQRALAPLRSMAGETPIDTAAGWTRLRAGLEAGGAADKGSFFARVIRPRLTPAWGTALAVVLLAASFGFAPVRSWAQRILATLRVEKIEVVAVNPVVPSGLDPDRANKLLGQFISDNVVVTQQADKPRDAGSAEQAGRMAGFAVRGLSARTDPAEWSVVGEQAFHLTLNRDRLQSTLEEIGRSDIQLPASIDGAEIAVHIPKLVVARYGNFPDVSGVRDESSMEAAMSRLPEAELKKLLVLMQVPVPAVSVPRELNIAEVAEAGLEVAGMSPSDAHAFVESVDWTSTLVVPVPHEGGSVTKVEVDGVEGSLVTVPALRKRPANYDVIWVKNGVIYSLAGSGDGSDAVALADSLN